MVLRNAIWDGVAMRAAEVEVEGEGDLELWEVEPSESRPSRRVMAWESGRVSGGSKYGEGLVGWVMI